MIGKWTSRTAILCLTSAACLVGSARAELPLASLLSFNQVEADPNKDYRISEDNGPWMIMASAFSGEGSEQQARELVMELRRRYKLEAYVHQAKFDLGKAEPRGVNRYGGRLTGRYRHGSEVKEIAVMVGNYRSADDPKAQEALRKLKYSRPSSLESDSRKQTNQSLAGWRKTQKQVQRLIGSAKQKTGPMGHAFVTTNPLLPKDFFSAPGVDKLVVEMNRKVKHSLLNCPGKYTVRVATFKGNVFIEPGEIREIESGKRVENKLEKAAEMAYLLTEALRLKGWEAYEFHDRYSSSVAVGSFEQIGVPGAGGKTVVDPRILKIVETFGAQAINGPTPKGAVPAEVQTITVLDSTGNRVKIDFDVQPVPVRVPKRSISRELAGGRF